MYFLDSSTAVPANADMPQGPTWATQFQCIGMARTKANSSNLNRRNRINLDCVEYPARKGGEFNRTIRLVFFLLRFIRPSVIQRERANAPAAN